MGDSVEERPEVIVCRMVGVCLVAEIDRAEVERRGVHSATYRKDEQRRQEQKRRSRHIPFDQRFKHAVSHEPRICQIGQKDDERDGKDGFA